MHARKLRSDHFAKYEGELIEKGWIRSLDRPDLPAKRIVKIVKGWRSRAERSRLKSSPKTRENGSQNLGERLPSFGSAPEVGETFSQNLGEFSQNLGGINRNTSPPAHDQPMLARAQEEQTAGDDFSAAEIALLSILGWGLVPNPERAKQVKCAAAELEDLAVCYGANYAPLPERIARFPDYAKAQKFSTWTLRAVVNHWKRCVDWLTPRQAQNAPIATTNVESDCPACKAPMAFVTNPDLPTQAYCRAEDRNWIFDSEQDRWIPEIQNNTR
jgi:hypothetical protein